MISHGLATERGCGMGWGEDGFEGVRKRNMDGRGQIVGDADNPSRHPTYIYIYTV